MAKHIEAHPQAAKLRFTIKDSIPVYSWDLSSWKTAALVVPATAATVNVTKAQVAARLWDVTERIIKDFEWGKLKRSG